MVAPLMTATAGRPTIDKARIGKAVSAARRSAPARARRLGTSSPSTSETNVMASTTSARAIESLCSATNGDGGVRQGLLQAIDDPRTAIDRRQRPHQRDPDLHGGQERVGMVGQGERGAAPRLPRLGLLLQAAAARGQDGDLGPGEKAVGQDQDQDDDDFPSDAHNVRSSGREKRHTPAGNCTGDWRPGRSQPVDIAASACE